MITIAGGIILAVVIFVLLGAMFVGFADGFLTGVITFLFWGTVLVILVSCLA